MNPERIVKQAVNTAKSIGEFLLWYVRDLETPPTPASIQYFPEDTPPDSMDRRLTA